MPIESSAPVFGMRRPAVLAALLLIMAPAAQAAELAGPAGAPPGLTQVQWRPGYDQDRRFDPNDRYGRRYEDNRRSDEYRRRDDEREYGGDRDYRRDRRYGNDQRRPDRRSGPAHGGTYQASCDSAQQQGNTLVAVCRDGHGGRVQSQLDLQRCGNSDIANVNGYLRCGNVQGTGGRVR